MTNAKNIQGKGMSFAAGISIVSGVLIILSSLIAWSEFATSIFGFRGMWWLDNSMVDRWAGQEEQAREVEDITVRAPIVAVITSLTSGFLVLLSGAMMYLRPLRKRIWGVMVLIFCVMALLSLGGFVFGIALGVIGGILAIANRQVVG
jgi:hypothetical protein